MTLDMTTPLHFDACDNYGHVLQVHDGKRQIAIVDVCADTDGTPRHDYGQATAEALAYAKLFTAAPALLEIAKHHRHLLSELHAGNAFSKEHLWRALTDAETVLAQAGAS